MRSKTGMETFIGIFSSAKADSMRQERMRTASIDSKLQDLISKSDVIVRLLQGQLDLLNTQKVKVEGNLADTLTERETTVGTLESVRAEIAALDPPSDRAGKPHLDGTVGRTECKVQRAGAG
jgi:hypothetical protein